MKKQSGLSPRTKRHGRNVDATMSACERKELAALEKLPDSVIDTSDIPEVTDWSKVRVGRFYRSIDRGRNRP